MAVDAASLRTSDALVVLAANDGSRTYCGRIADGPICGSIPRVDETNLDRLPPISDHPRNTPWLTVKEAAEYIRAKDGALIRAAIKLGYQPGYRYGKSEIRLLTCDLDEWLKSQPWEPRK
jgi:excisionase family DNA binding protein